MRRRSKTGCKAAVPKRGTAQKASPRRSSSAAGPESEVVRLKRELREAQEQQAATAEVLRLISSSPGDLKSVFAAILENVSQICTVKFATLWLAEADALRAVALHDAPASYAAARRDGLIRPGPKTLIGRVAGTKRVVHIDDITAGEGYRERDPLAVTNVEEHGIRTMLGVPDAQRGRVCRCHHHLSPGGPAVHRQADRAGTELRRPGRHRHREYAAAQRIARVAGAADGDADVLRVISSSPGELEPVFQAMLENATRICDAKFGTLLLCEGDRLRRVAMHNAPPDYAEFNEKREPVVDRGISVRRSRVSSRTKRSCTSPICSWSRLPTTHSPSSPVPAPCSACRCSRTTS